MSVIRTSLSLIAFGFTIYQFFEELTTAGTVRAAAGAPRNFGLSLILTGICLLVAGILYHVRFMLGLRTLREEMKAEGLIHAESVFPVSYSLIAAVLLLVLGVFAGVSVVLKVGPFH
jgi:putative membrane protein